LERQRATFAWKCADLDEAGLRTTIDTSKLTLGGLLKHLAYMEDINFTSDFAGHALPAPWAAAEGRPGDWVWRTAADDSPDQLQAWWGRRSTGHAWLSGRRWPIRVSTPQRRHLTGAAMCCGGSWSISLRSTPGIPDTLTYCAKPWTVG
jgi:hypothetical protein